MSTSICTLFEKHYHYGVAALVNSLYHQGFRGAVYAGYRGSLPFWSSAAEQNPSLEWDGASTFYVVDGLQLHFLPLKTNYHLTNYKPDFIHQLWKGPAKEAENFYYFDPDIVVTAPWGFFEEWVSYGLALCEDVNSPLAEHHPRRKAWRSYFGERGIPLQFKEAVYANGGFIGLTKKTRSFLSVWQTIQETMAPAIGGLQCSQFNDYAALPEGAKGPFAPFARTDQDALNAAVEAWNGEVSFIGQEGMAFKSGVPLMPHALGPPKPWQWKPLAQAIVGYPPRVVDRGYWKYANGPIFSQPTNLFIRRQIAIKLAALIGRFYRRC